MKAISLWQPWATLIAIGAKQYETRSWSTDYRGPLVIHAAKRPNELKELREAIYMKTAGGRIRENATEFERFAITAIYKHQGEAIGAFIPTLPLGAALCVVDLVDCIKTDIIAPDYLTLQEKAFGNYQPGRYAWKLANYRYFKTPVPMRGAQGIFETPIILPFRDLVYPY